MYLNQCPLAGKKICSYIRPMKRILLTITACFAWLLFSNHKADEGMFPLSELKNLDLKKAGLRMDPLALYNPNGISQIDAIVRVGGCTGSFVSNDGLIVTNHHCAFGFVAAISDTINNYINTQQKKKLSKIDVQSSLDASLTGIAQSVAHGRV